MRQEVKGHKHTTAGKNKQRQGREADPLRTKVEEAKEKYRDDVSLRGNVFVGMMAGDGMIAA
jgi:hypothetical protein